MLIFLNACTKKFLTLKTSHFIESGVSRACRECEDGESLVTNAVRTTVILVFIYIQKWLLLQCTTQILATLTFHVYNFRTIYAIYFSKIVVMLITL